MTPGRKERTMPTTLHRLTQAIEWHKAGDLAQAERIYG
jgi:hypothetical protein